MQLSDDNRFIFSDLDGYTPHISRLLHMMYYVRRTTINIVQELSAEMLDIQVLDNGNTIAMLLAHIAGTEVFFQTVTFDRNVTAFDTPEMQLGDAGRQAFRGYGIKVYLARLESARSTTLEQFAKRDDAWLHETHHYFGEENDGWSNYFCWFHVMQDELRHQGQILILRKEIERLNNLKS